MKILFREQHQQAAQISRRLQLGFWLGMLGAYLIYSLIFTSLSYAVIHFYNLGVATPIALNHTAILHYAFLIALLPAIIVLMVYQEQLFLFRSQKASEFGRSLGAEPLNLKNKKQYRFQQLVEEMSIASGEKIPELLIFPRDGSINAFLLAGGENSVALGISQGAIDYLSRDELQAIIAHQFGHLKDGYLPTFTRLAAMTTAFSAIENYCTHGAVSSVALERNLVPNPLRELANETAIGEFFALFGRLFHQYGLWLQAAFSLQRIKMADARAIQYTRYPQTLEMVLKKAIALKTKGVQRIFPPRHFAHIFFHHEESTLFKAQQTHPSLESRVTTLGGKITAEEKEALLFEMEGKIREEIAINPTQHYRSLFDSTTLLYPLLSLERLTKKEYFPTSINPQSAFLAYFLYHSGATVADLQQQEILEKQQLIAISQAIMVIEKIPPLAQLALLPQLSKFAASSGQNNIKLTADIEKLVHLNGQVSEFEACGLMFWQATITIRKPIHLIDCRADIAALFSFLIEKNKVDKAAYQALIQQVFPHHCPSFSPLVESNSQQLLNLCQIVARLRNLSSSNRHLLAAVISRFYEERKKISLRQAYLRYTLLHLLN